MTEKKGLCVFGKEKPYKEIHFDCDQNTNTFSLSIHKPYKNNHSNRELIKISFTDRESIHEMIRALLMLDLFMKYTTAR